MHIRYIPADPAGNLTALVLSPVPAGERAALAARLMATCPEGFEQVGYVDEASLLSDFPRLDMMGGEFCGNAARAFGLYAALRRGLDEQSLCVRISGAQRPVSVTLDAGRGEAYADMPLPLRTEHIEVCGRTVPVVRMEGIAHAILLDTPPAGDAADAVLRAMPPEDAQGVLFTQGSRMTPLVSVTASATRVWESSCGSGSVALAVLLAEQAGRDGVFDYAFDEPGGRLCVRVSLRGGRAVRAVMGGSVTLGAEREIGLPLKPA